MKSKNNKTKATNNELHILTYAATNVHKDMGSFAYSITEGATVEQFLCPTSNEIKVFLIGIKVLVKTFPNSNLIIYLPFSEKGVFSLVEKENLAIGRINPDSPDLTFLKYSCDDLLKKWDQVAAEPIVVPACPNQSQSLSSWYVNTVHGCQAAGYDDEKAKFIATRGLSRALTPEEEDQVAQKLSEAEGSLT